MIDFSHEPKHTVSIETKNRKICTAIPSPETLQILEDCKKFEPKSMNNQIPIVWDRASGFNVWDISGNKWIDFTSTIFVTNVGHSHPRIKNAIKQMVDGDLLNAYYYPTKIRSEFSKYILEKTTGGKFDKVLLLSTGSEANEAAIKMARIRKYKKDPQSKNVVLGFENSYHGKTFGSQLAGGKTKEKYWINDKTNNLHLPYPYPEKLENRSGSEFFESSILQLLENNNLKPSDICAIISEPYQGWCAVFIPKDYALQMRKFCNKHDILFICDEVQSGFGRTGKMFAYEHLGIVPDILVCGKGISSSLPVSAVLTSTEIADCDESFNSTHGGNPVGVAASLESLKIIEDENLVSESSRKGSILELELNKWKNEMPEYISKIYCKGLLASVFIESCNDKINNSDFVDMLIEEATRQGLMSIRTASGTLKIGPPLCITDDALVEGVEVLKNSLRVCLDILV
jgi:4-aminobutyrate aminotransferase-like enzyme